MEAQIMQMSDPPAVADSSHNSGASPVQHRGTLETTSPGVKQLLSSSGSPLDAATRTFMESRFGYDFSQVRLHTGPGAARSADLLAARAYTVGQDVVLGEGQYRPGTPEGRQLLAHELTHVVQQSEGRSTPVIQRKLKVSGEGADIQAMFKLLEQDSGLTLKYDRKTNLVSIAASSAKPKSPEMANRLQAIISDTKQDAEIHVGRTQGGVSFGAFPTDLSHPVQEIRIDMMLDLEKGAPGAGAAKLLHEIVENYEGHALTDYNWTSAFLEAHERAVQVENAVESELGHPGERRNTFPVVRGKGKKQVLTSIEDRSSYFLVYDTPFGWGSDRIFNARRVGRVPVSTYTIDGFSATSTDVPAVAAKTLAALAVDMKNNPTASALAEGFASGAKSSQENQRLARDRAESVQDEVVKLVGESSNTSWRRFQLVGNSDRTRNQVVVTLERPDL